MDCLARKQRGIASKLGATAGTNKTGINLTPSRAKIPFGSIRKDYYWDVWLMLMMMTIFTLCRNKNNPVPQRDLQPRITVWRGSSYFIFKFYCCQRREQTSLADLLTSSQFQYHLKLGNIFNTTLERKYFLQLIIFLMKRRNPFGRFDTKRIYWMGCPLSWQNHINIQP